MIAEDWNIELVRAREAQALLPQRPGRGRLVDWGNIRVASIDTGYTAHPVFGGAGAWLLPGAGLNLLEEGQPPVDPLRYEGSPGHGTRTASILCGDRRAIGGAVLEVGVAPQVPVVPYRAINHVVIGQKGQRQLLARAIDHATNDAECQVISMSLGTPFFGLVFPGSTIPLPPPLPGQTGGLGRAVDDSYERGVIVVAAAGQVVDSVCYPAKYHRAICTAGVDAQRRAWVAYDAGAETVDVWAPAEDVMRAEAVDTTRGSPATYSGVADDPTFTGSGSSAGSHDGSFSQKGAGTSYATVHVAAAAAMWLRKHDSALDRAYGSERWKRVEAFRQLLIDTKRRLSGAEQPENDTGILDIEMLLRAALPSSATLEKRAPGNDMFM